MLEKFSRRLFGFDVFISFALTGIGRSTRTYAIDLAQRLRAKDITVFFSEDEMRGDELAPMLANGLRRSRTLVVLVNPGTLAEPRIVRKEVEEFRRLVPHGRVLPISLKGALSPSENDQTAVELARSADEWLRFRDRLWITEHQESAPLEHCSEEVVEEIVKTLEGAHANVKWRRLVAATLAILALLTVMALGLAWRAARSEREAVKELQRAVAMQLVTEARLGLDGASGERWTISLRKLLTGRALGATREADEVLSHQLQTHPPTLARIWDVGAPISDFSLGADGKIALLTEGPALRLAAEDEEARALTVQGDGIEPRDGVRAFPCADATDCLIVATFNGLIHRIVGTSTGRPRIDWQANRGGTITSMVLSPDGGIAVTADGGLTFVSHNELHARDLKTRKDLWGEAANVTALAVCPRPDLNMLAVGNSDGEITVRHIASGEVVRTWRTDGDPYHVVNALAFDPKCKRLLSAHGYNLNDTDKPAKGEHPISIWDLDAPNAKPALLIGHQSFVMDISVSPDGLLAASGSRDGEVRLWDLEHGRAQPMPLAPSEVSSGSDAARELPLTGHQGAVTRLRFDPSGHRLYSAGADGYLLAWDMQPPQEGSRPWAADGAFMHTGGRARKALAVATKTDMLLIGRESGVLAEYSLSTGTPRADWPQPVSGSIQQIEIDPTEHWAVLAYRDEELNLKYEVRDLSTRMPVGSGWPYKDSYPYLAVFTSDGRRRIGCDSARNVEVRKMPEGQLLFSEALDKVSKPVEGLSIRRLTALCPSKEDRSYEPRRQVLFGNQFAEPGHGGAARIQSLAKSKVEWRQIGKKAENDTVDLMAFAKDGDTLVTASKGGEVHLWNTITGRAEGMAMRFRWGEPMSIAITPSADRVAVLSAGTVQVFLTPYHDGRSACAWLPRSELPGEWKAWVGDRIPMRPVCRRPAASNKLAVHGSRSLTASAKASADPR